MPEQSETMREWLTRRRLLITPAMEEDKAFIDGPAPALTDRTQPTSADWKDGYETGFAEGASGRFNPDGSYSTPITREDEQRALDKGIAEEHRLNPALKNLPASSNHAAKIRCAYCGSDATDRPNADYACCWDCYRKMHGRSIPNREATRCPGCHRVFDAREIVCPRCRATPNRVLTADEAKEFARWFVANYSDALKALADE